MKFMKMALVGLAAGLLLAACDEKSSGGDNDDKDAGAGDPLPGEEMDVFELVDDFGACVNLGNWLEAPDQDWGVICEEEDIERIAEMGFGTVRVPIRWETRAMMESPYTIEEEFFELVDDLLDWCEAADLKAVINMHHHDAFFEDAEAYKEMFLTLWEQIATRYKDRPESVVFEIMNEPHDSLTAVLWNEYLADALDVIRETNPYRAVVIGTADWGGIGAMNKLELPDDPNLIFTFHYYEPFQFTHQGASWSEGSEEWLGTTWDATPFEKLEMLNAMDAVSEWADENEVPVFMGEFGAYSEGDDDSRARWTEHLARYAEDAGFSWCYWEYKAGFGVWDPASEDWNTFLTDALFNDDYSILEIDMTALGDNLLENGDFEDGSTGWQENFYGGEATSTITDDGVLAIEVTEVGENPWEVQYIGELPPITADQAYAISFQAWAEAPRGLDAGVQHMADPWDTYAFASYSLSTEPTVQVINFTASADDDIAAFVLNVGGETGTVYVDNVVMVIQ